jgi:hypothetical protein
MDHQVEDLVDLGLELALAHAHASKSPVELDCRWAVLKVSTLTVDVKFQGGLMPVCWNSRDTSLIYEN